MCPNPLSAPLSFILGQGSAPLKLEVSVTPSDEVQRLRTRVHELETELNALQSSYNRVEYLYRCEVLVNAQLLDHCKDRGLRVPKRLYQRPDSFDQLSGGDAGA